MLRDEWVVQRRSVRLAAAGFFALWFYAPGAAAQETSECAVPSSWLSDGYCDPSANNAACGFDHGDCCEETCEDGIYACGYNGYACLIDAGAPADEPDAGFLEDDAGAAPEATLDAGSTPSDGSLDEEEDDTEPDPEPALVQPVSTTPFSAVEHGSSQDRSVQARNAIKRQGGCRCTTAGQNPIAALAGLGVIALLWRRRR